MALAVPRASAEDPPPIAFEWSCDARAIALAPGGDIYVSTNSRLLLFGRFGALVGDRTPGATGCSFNGIRSLFVGAAGDIHASNYCVQKFSPTGQLLWARTGGSQGVAVDADGRVYSIHPEDAVLRFSPGGILINTWVAGDLGSGRFHAAQHLVVSPLGFIYLTDTGNDRVQKYDMEMNPVSSWELVDGNFRFTQPSGIAADASGNIYVTTLVPAQIFKYTADGQLLARWGSAGTAPGQIKEPVELVVHATGDVYVVDAGLKVVMYGTRRPGDPPPPPALPLQARINDALPGATIRVAAGTYRENLDFKGKALILVSDDGPEVTILDGSAVPNDPVLRIGGSSVGGAVRGFTVTGSRGESTILIEGATVDIEDNVIRDNAAIGIDIQAGTVGIRRNSFLNNDHWTSWTSFGGAISVASTSPGQAGTAIVEGNVFRGNRSGFGSALFAGDAIVEFRDNLVEDNWCAYDGGAIFLWNSMRSAVVERNQFLRNTAEDHGGAIAAWHAYGGHADIRFNLFAHNRANGQGANGTGGAVHLAGASGTFTNNTVAFNSAGQECGGGGIALDRRDWPSTWIIVRNIIAWNGERGVIATGSAGPASVERNLIYGNNLSDLNCSGISSHALADVGKNVAQDPLFCDSDGGNFHLATASPALAGAVPWGAYTEAGCNLVPVVPSTWSSIKARFGSGR